MHPFVSLATRHVAEEQMDAVTLPSDEYDAVLRDLARVNGVTLAGRATDKFLAAVYARHASARPWRILDVGFGQGDMLRRIARWAERQGQAVALSGIDLNPKSAPSARAATPDDIAIDWRTGDYRELAGDGWDIVISSLVAHHMDDDERREFLAFMEGEAALGWFVNDLHRHRFAFVGFPLLARLMGVHPIVRADGQLSIARSFRPHEWAAQLAAVGLSDAARVDRRFPFRLCVARIK